MKSEWLVKEDESIVGKDTSLGIVGRGCPRQKSMDRNEGKSMYIR